MVVFDMLKCYYSDMKKIFWVFFLLIFGIGAFAGEYETALASGKPVVLYIYTAYCGYCRKFDPIYDKLSGIHGKSYKFVSLDAGTPYGRYVMWKLGAGYVPFVLVTDLKNKKAKVINPSCSIEFACADKELRNF